MKNRHSLFFALLAFGFLALASCVDKDFDAPPGEGTIDIQANTTIADLKSRHTLGQFEQIEEDLIIRGVVIADDRSGNFYKSMVIQDATGGIEVRINATDFYNDYPIGREVFIKCKDLWLGDYNNLPQIGGGIYVDNGSTSLAQIEQLLIEEHIFKGKKDQFVTPRQVTIPDLNEDLVSTLIRIEGVEFAVADTAQTFADPVNQFSENRTLTDCNGNTVILRSSGYAEFAGASLPNGNGSMVGVFSVFRTDFQLYIRELDDLQLDGPRCTSGPSGDYLTIEQVRNLYSGSTSTTPSNKRVKGVVISDRANSNITSRNLVIQDESNRGIVIRFDQTHPFNMGESIDVNISGVEISEFNGLLQLNNVPLSNAASLGNGVLPTPKELSISDILADFENLESTLVLVKDVAITKTGGNNYGGTCTLNDGSGTMTLYTTSYSSFTDEPIPSEAVDLTAIVSQGGNQEEEQLTIRNLDDVSGSGGGGGGDDSINESFNSLNDDQDVSLSGWKNIAVKGSRLWRVQVFDGNHYAQATAYNDSSPEMETWLVTPVLDGVNTLSFESAQAFWVHDGLSVWVSSDFDGQNVSSANWQPLNCRLAGSSDDDHDWIPSGDIDLTAFTQPIVIGFRYIGSGGGETTSYRLDNIVVTE